ncbi:MAG: hypothetical protein JW863_02180 [Chitinispirillaceae bacterium]|nr:hypothetical protein [Chitinispirillaceae bacterium]
MYELIVDTANNRLTVILSGIIGKMESEKIAREMVAACSRLKRGFDVINDISRYEAADKKSEDVFKGVIEFFKIRGVRKVIRVVGGSKAALVKFADVTKTVSNYTVQYVPTMEAAVKLLDS